MCRVWRKKILKISRPTCRCLADDKYAKSGTMKTYFYFSRRSQKCMSVSRYWSPHIISEYYIIVVEVVEEELTPIDLRDRYYIRIYILQLYQQSGTRLRTIYCDWVRRRRVRRVISILLCFINKCIYIYILKYHGYSGSTTV